MIIGPTLTLEELEEQLTVNVEKLRRELNDLDRKLAELQHEANSTNPYIYKDGERVKNENYQIVQENLRKVYQEIVDGTERLDFMKEKLSELETIEEDSQGRVVKSRDKITLSLNDCLLLGIEVEK